MKRIILIALLCIFSINLFAQTYKLEDVYYDRLEETYLSHWNILEDAELAEKNTFSLWGFQRYDESWILAYEVEYFKGDAQSTYKFLETLNLFTEKYKD